MPPRSTSRDSLPNVRLAVSGDPPSRSVGLRWIAFLAVRYIAGHVGVRMAVEKGDSSPDQVSVSALKTRSANNWFPSADIWQPSENS